MRARYRLLLSALAAVLTVGCGESPTAPPPPPPPTYSAVVHVFYDEDEDGVRDKDEPTAVPNVEVDIGGAKGVSVALSGRAELMGIPEGTYPILFGPAPPYYEVGKAQPLTVPQANGDQAYVPAVLPIGSNTPALYMAFGDSITDGDGSASGFGYRRRLENQLRVLLRQAAVSNEGIGGTRSSTGADRIQRSLQRVRPAYTLILYGTNDWNEGECRRQFPCYTIDSLRRMIRACKARESLPLVGSIPPVNVGYDARTPPGRQVWVQDMNALIETMVREEEAVYVDIYSAMMAEPNYRSLFYDHVHPNDKGYEIVANQWFKAITEAAAPRTATTMAPFIEKKDYGEPPPLGPGEE